MNPSSTTRTRAPEPRSLPNSLSSDHATDSLDTVISATLLVGLLTGFIARLAYTVALVNFPSESSGLETAELPFWGKVTVAAGATFCSAAGLLAALGGGFRRAGWVTGVALVSLQVWMLGHSYRAFSDGFENYELFGSKGPATWITMVCLYAGMRTQCWRLIGPALWFCAAAACIHALVGFTAIGLSDRMHMLRYLIVPGQILAVTAPWTMYSTIHRGVALRLLGTLPAVAFLLVSLFTRTRSWTLLALIYLAAWPLLEWRTTRDRQGGQALSRLLIYVAGTFLVALVITFQLADSLDRAYSMLADRVMDDTRSLQYEEFFASGMGQSLLLGLGPRGTWTFLGREYGYLEGGFMTMAFTGGVPLVLLYILLVARPGILALHRSREPAVLACAVALMVWCIAQCGLGIYLAPATTLHHYIVLLYAGRCTAVLSGRHRPA